MSTYQGPHVAVTQKFELSPPNIAVEGLPSVVVGTAYDVYEKESLGNAPGLSSGTAGGAAVSQLSWGHDKVVFDHTVVGKRGFDFYPPKVYVRAADDDYEIESEDIELDTNGVKFDASDTYPYETVLEGASEAYVPYYSATTTVTISATDLQTVNITNGAVVTANIQKGMKVYVTIAAVKTLVGVVGQAPTSETKIKLATPYTAAVPAGTAIEIGIASDTLTGYPCCFYDPNADFYASKVTIGDILELNTNDLGEEIMATVTSIVNKNMLRVYTDVKDENFLLELKSMQDATSTFTGTFNVASYKLTRLIAFSQTRYEDAESLALVAKVDTKRFTVAKASFSAYAAATGLYGDPELGFWFTICDDQTQVTNHRRFYEITSLFDDVASGNWVIGTDEDIYLDNDPDTAYTGTAEYFNMWDPQITNEVVADFRGVRTDEAGVVKRITSSDDITTAWSRDDDISVYNELAWMAATARAAAGGKVIYGVNVDASEDNLADQYSDAFDALKIYDVYSHALGTTDSGVNAIVAAYLADQSDPYQGHERIAALVYDQDDVFSQGSDTGNMATTGVITISGSLDPIAAGITVDDEVDIFDTDGVYVSTVNVTETPDPLTPTLIQTDYDSTALSSYTFKFKTARPSEEANKLSVIQYGDRRVKTMWPGYFTADVGDDTLTLPPYYLSADIVGRDSRIIVSQSFTNMNYTPYGLSNIVLNTNFRYTKDELDTIGGGGIDIMIQSASLSQTIRSRHDLTSNMDAVEYREWSITKQADVCAKTFRSAIEPYVGRYNITDELFAFLAQVCGVVANKLTKTPGIVAAVNVNSIKRDEVIADKVNIYITVTVFVAGNYYDVELLVKSR